MSQQSVDVEVETLDGTECENCKVITDQYAYLKEKLRKQSLTIDSLLATQSEDQNVMDSQTHGPPNDLK